MKVLALLVLCAAPALTQTALAQTNSQTTTSQTGSAQAAAVTRSTAPVPLVPAPAADPAVHPDGSATFTLHFPNAQAVQLELEGAAAPVPMQQSAPGDWTLTTGPLAPEYYSYSFLVDGVPVVDPHNVSLKPSAFRVQSVFLVPGHKLWEPRDVPHGVLHQHTYRSAILQADSTYFVYTPPNYDPSHKYPVLYLLHGYSDEASAWTAMGKANTILDNLLAEHRAEPMIVVMPLGYGDLDMIRHGWAAWQDTALVRRNFQQFDQALYTEVMPRVTAQYPLSPRREDHAIAGLSMGGAETLLTGLNHPRDYAYIGAFSAGGLGSSGFAQLFPGVTPSTAPALNRDLRLLWISCGTEDGLFPPNQALIAWLQGQGLHPKVVEMPGRHTWMVWRENLSEFLPLLFQPMP